MYIKIVIHSKSFSLFFIIYFIRTFPPMQQLKKLPYLILLLPMGVMAQSTTTLPTPTTSYTPQFRYYGSATDTLKQVWVNSGSKYNRWYTATEIQKLYGKSFTQKIDSIKSANNVWTGNNDYENGTAKLRLNSAGLAFSYMDSPQSGITFGNNTLEYNANIKHTFKINGVEKIIIDGVGIKNYAGKYALFQGYVPDSATISNTYASKDSIVNTNTNSKTQIPNTYALYSSTNITTALIAPSVTGNIRNDQGAVIELNDGRFMVVYGHFGVLPMDASTAVIYQAFSSDRGRTWGTPTLLVDTLAGGKSVQVPSLHKKANGNIVMLFFARWTTTPTATSKLYQIEYSPDMSTIVTAAAPFQTNDTYYVPNSSRITEDKANGRLLFPVGKMVAGTTGSSTTSTYQGRLYVSTDDGDTWTDNGLGITGVTNVGGFGGVIEPGIYNWPQQGLVYYYRTLVGTVYANLLSYSAGTYSAGSAFSTNLAASNSAIDIQYLAKKNQLIAAHTRYIGTDPTLQTNKTDIDLSMSNDGLTWQTIQNIVHVPSGQLVNIPTIHIDTLTDNVGIGYSATSVVNTHYSYFNKVYPASYINTQFLQPYQVISNQGTALVPRATMNVGYGLTGADNYPSTDLKADTSKLLTVLNLFPTTDTRYLRNNKMGTITLPTSTTALQAADESLRLATTTVSTSNTTHAASPFLRLFGGIWNGTVNSSRGFTGQVVGISGTNTGYTLDIGSTDFAKAISVVGTTGAVTFRQIPTGVVKSTSGLLSSGTVSLTSEVTGVLPVANGGTGKATITSGALQKGNGTGIMADALAGTDYISPTTGDTRYGTINNYTASGTGAATTIVIPHGLTGITGTSKVIVQPLNAASAGVSYVTVDATNLNVVYTVAPASGTNNLSYSAHIKP